MSTITHGDRAMQAAVEAFGMKNERAAAVYIFIAAARHLGRVVNDPKTAGELAYMMADELATEEPR